LGCRVDETVDGRIWAEIKMDLGASNGTIHVIDGVLIPPAS
jgi:uncharacterized surface protein with fasciclin (FAS1) repeats